MNHKINDIISLNIEIRKSGTKAISFNKDLETKEFVIIAINHVMQSYYVLIDDDMLGWIISKYHIEQFDIDPKYNGKKFFEVTDAAISG